MQESGEMYLETILVLGKEQNKVRSIDIASRMDFSKASVSRAMTKLKTDDFILMDAEGFIALTEKGRSLANKMYERHIVLSKALMSLGIDEVTAVKDACKMEHDLSDQTFTAIKQHLEKNVK